MGNTKQEFTLWRLELLSRLPEYTLTLTPNRLYLQKGDKRGQRS